MARQTITPVSVTGKWPAALAALTLTAADATNKEQMRLTGREILIVWNSGASSRTVTINSVADNVTGRSGDITTATIAAGAMKMIGPLDPNGWAQTNGYLNFEASHADIQYAAILLP